METAADFLFALRRKGVSVWSENGALRYKAAKGALAPEELLELRALKDDILAFLAQSSRSTQSDVMLRPRARDVPVPLTFAQRWMWEGLQLSKRPSMRMVAGAMNVSGQLDVESLRRCLVELARRHESLRTRIVSVDGMPRQCIDDPPVSDNLQIADLSASSADAREIEAKRLIEDLVYEPVLVAEGPLWVTRLLKLTEREYILVLALDHLISDGASMGILWRDLGSLYSQVALTDTSAQFADYAVWEQSAARSQLDQSRVAHWKKHLEGARRVRLFGDDRARLQCGTVPIQFDATLSGALRELSRRQGATLTMSVLAAFAATILRWCDESEVVIPFVSLGRRQRALENTIGFFGYPIFLRIRLEANDTFRDLLSKVVSEYSAAYEHDDSYEIAATDPAAEFVWNPTFNWFPRAFDSDPGRVTRLPAGEHTIELRPRRIEIMLRDDMPWERELGLRLSEQEGGIAGELVYRTGNVPLHVIEQFNDCFHWFAQKLASEPDACVRLAHARVHPITAS